MCQEGFANVEDRISFWTKNRLCQLRKECFNFISCSKYPQIPSAQAPLWGPYPQRACQPSPPRAALPRQVSPGPLLRPRPALFAAPWQPPCVARRRQGQPAPARASSPQPGPAALGGCCGAAATRVPRLQTRSPAGGCGCRPSRLQVRDAVEAAYHWYVALSVQGLGMSPCQTGAGPRAGWFQGQGHGYKRRGFWTARFKLARQSSSIWRQKFTPLKWHHKRWNNLLEWMTFSYLGMPTFFWILSYGL